MKKALLVVDIQKDFCIGGTLEVSGTASLINPLSQFIKERYQQGDIIVYTRDWHPLDHSSFKSNGGVWPKHCVVQTCGSDFHPSLYLAPVSIVVNKGINKELDGYSAFEETGLDIMLNQAHVTDISITGIATEYCVMSTALDAVNLGFKTKVLKDFTRGINSSDIVKAYDNMVNHNISLVNK